MLIGTLLYGRNVQEPGMEVAHQPAGDSPAQDVEVAVAKAARWIEPTARLGYAAKGFVYAMIGVVALLAALRIQAGERGDDTNQRGILNFLGRQPFGVAILLTIAVGLFGYSLWRLISATLNAEDQSVLKRAGYAFSGLAYGYLAYVAAMAAFGIPADSNDSRFARNLADKPFGHWLLIGAGMVMLSIAGAQAWNAATAGFKRVFKLKEMKRWHGVTAIWLGRIGLFSRAILFGLIGGFLISAGWHDNVREAGGVSRALQTMQHSAGGDWLLMADCIGLVCYGLFMFFEARFRRIRLADPELVEAVNEPCPNRSTSAASRPC